MGILRAASVPRQGSLNVNNTRHEQSLFYGSTRSMHKAAHHAILGRFRGQDQCSAGQSPGQHNVVDGVLYKKERGER